MDPKWIANEVQNGRFLFCPNGSHLHNMMIKNIFNGLIKFLKDVDNGTFKKGITQKC
jgi:proline iminopeptidase